MSQEEMQAFLLEKSQNLGEAETIIEESSKKLPKPKYNSGLDITKAGKAGGMIYSPRLFNQTNYHSLHENAYQVSCKSIPILIYLPFHNIISLNFYDKYVKC